MIRTRKKQSVADTYNLQVKFNFSKEKPREYTGFAEAEYHEERHEQNAEHYQ